MIRPDQIPDEVVEAVMYCFHTRSSARAAIAAALSAWQGESKRGCGITMNVLLSPCRRRKITVIDDETLFWPY